jgi:hypothetical protein
VQEVQADQHRRHIEALLVVILRLAQLLQLAVVTEHKMKLVEMAGLAVAAPAQPILLAKEPRGRAIMAA